ncbi:MAG TPA: FtsW/RodA/SpoVE family cell cycle protein [Atopostipes sp.]|nr:FtsW/RodA/SpoVE family cell cycle protein [Atopostipes sp.]
MLKERLKLIDKWIAIPFIILILFSIIAVYSASSYSAMEEYGTPNHYLVRQSIVVVVSLIMAFFVYIFPFRVLKKKKMILLGTIGTFILLIVVLFLPPVLGARRWIPLPVFNLQPAEFAKIFVIWYLAYIFSRNQKELESEFFQTILRPSILVGVVFFLILMQPDTGTAIIIALMTVFMLSASGASLKYGFLFILSGMTLVGGLTFIIYNFGESIPFLGYRYDRFLGLWDPFGYYESYGNQLVNSYYALSRGGLFGVGIGNSVQKTGYLPFPYTDFIIAIVGEELGLAGVTGVLVALGTIIGRSFYLGSHSKDSFNSLIYIGVGSMLLVQSLINLAGLTGLIPITGVTFPLLSYGGSSLMVVSISVALVANASTQDRLKLNM